MIYYKNINTNNQNNLNNVHSKRFNTSVLFETAFYDDYSTFNMFKIGLLTKEICNCTKNNINIITKNRNNSNIVR